MSSSSDSKKGMGIPVRFLGELAVLWRTGGEVGLLLGELGVVWWGWSDVGEPPLLHELAVLQGVVDYDRYSYLYL